MLFLANDNFKTFNIVFINISVLLYGFGIRRSNLSRMLQKPNIFQIILLYIYCGKFRIKDCA